MSDKIDMQNYPYKKGDLLKNGIRVISVIKGDVNDTFKGYRCRIVKGLDEQGKRIYVPGTVVVKTLDGLSEPKNFRGGKSLEIIENIPDPDAARVYFRMPNKTSGSSVLPPDEFMELAMKDKEEIVPSEDFNIAEEKAEVPNENIAESDSEFCQGLTAKSKPCKSKPLPGTGYCHSHRSQKK